MEGAKRHIKFMLMVFWEKNLSEKIGHLSPKMMHGHNSGFALRVFI